MESARYFEKATGKEIFGKDAWEHATESTIDFRMRPFSLYTYDDKVEVKPVYFENVKILWRPQEQEADRASEFFNDEDSLALQYPTGDVAPTPEKLDELKAVISEKLQESFPAEILDEKYGWLEHDVGCLYDTDAIGNGEFTIESYGLREENDTKPRDATDEHFYQLEEIKEDL